jgi:hypothetical protein
VLATAQQLCGSAARRLHDPSARRAASRKQRRGSAGPPNAAASAATASWAALSVALAHSALLVRFTLQDHRSIQPGTATDALAKWLLAMARVANAPTAILGCDARSSSAVPAAGGAALGCADRVVGGTSLNRDRFRAAVAVCGSSTTGAGRLPSMLWPRAETRGGRLLRAERLRHTRHEPLHYRCAFASEPWRRRFRCADGDSDHRCALPAGSGHAFG